MQTATITVGNLTATLQRTTDINFLDPQLQAVLANVIALNVSLNLKSLTMKPVDPPVPNKYKYKMNLVDLRKWVQTVEFFGIGDAKMDFTCDLFTMSEIVQHRIVRDGILNLVASNGFTNLSFEWS